MARSAFERRVASPLGHATASAVERGLIGRSRRVEVSRSSHGRWQVAPDRPDPVSLLREQDQGRLPDLVPLRHERMAADPFSFFRGAAAVMAWDLTHAPNTCLYVQMCGDAHLANFGLYNAPNREIVFDANDFDETLPGPWEFDLKRLVVSLVVAGRGLGFSEARCADLVLGAVTEYHDVLDRLALLSDLDVWYFRIRMSDVRAAVGQDHEVLAIIDATTKRAVHHTSLSAFDKFVDTSGPSPMFRNVEPILTRLADLSEERAGALGENMEQILTSYQRSLPDHLRVLLSRYRVLDVARRVVGVGSVGTQCYIVLLEGRRMKDPFVLQIKQANPSVFESGLPSSKYRRPGTRVVAGQRLIQAASDVFLGEFALRGGTSYYVRQFRDAKGSFDVTSMSVHALNLYGQLCAAALARAHAKSGDALAIQGYLGKGDKFAKAMVAYAGAYADQNERDYQLFRTAHLGG